MFNERKTAQVAVFLLSREPQNRTDNLKLMKLLYLADKRAIEKLGFPLSGDHYASLDKGPLLSKTYNLSKHPQGSDSGYWESVITSLDKTGSEPEWQIGLKPAASKVEFDELSKAEIKVLEEIVNEFGSQSAAELVEYVHQFPEWVDPEGSSLPLSLKSIVAGMTNVTEEQANSILQEIQAYDWYQKELASS
jgi:uncharacterized phage-associated protein